MGQSFPGSDAWNSTSGIFTITMQSSDQNRFRLNAFPQRQDSNSSIRSDEDYGVSGCFNYASGATSVVIWKQIGHKAVRDINCWKIFVEQILDFEANFSVIWPQIVAVIFRYYPTSFGMTN